MALETKSTIDLIAGDMKTLIDQVADRAQNGTHDEFRYAWEQLQEKGHQMLSAIYHPPVNLN